MYKKLMLLLLCLFMCVLMISCTGATGAVGAAGPSGANGVVCASFQEGVYPSSVYALASDTYLFSGTPDTNYSGSLSCYVGRNGPAARAVFKFDISSMVPSGINVESAYLTVYAVATNALTITAHAITGPWDEAAATWNSSAVGVTWAAAGGDYGALQDSEIISVSNAFHTFEISPALVESWLAAPEANYGILLKSYDELINEYAGIQNSRAAVVSMRPKLSIYYTLP